MPPALVNREASGCFPSHPSDIGRPTGPRNPLLQDPLGQVSVFPRSNLSRRASFFSPLSIEGPFPDAAQCTVFALLFAAWLPTARA